MSFAVQRLFALIGNRVNEYVPVLAGGSGNAGAVPALNASGQLDATMMPPGVGADTQTVVASEALSAGALVNIYSASGTPTCRNADGSTTGKQADGFVLAAVASGASATVYLSGLNTAVAGLTPGLVFLSDTSVGATMAAGATTAGHTFQQVGVATATGMLQFNPQIAIVRA